MSQQTTKKTQADTRERLLASSLKAFGHRDYDSVSTREIVEMADANISAISYHFGGKRQLYLATACYLAERLQNGMKTQLDAVNMQARHATPDACRLLLNQLIHALVKNLLLGEFSEDGAEFIFREQHHPTDAFDILFEKLMQPMQQAFSLLIARIRGLSTNQTETILATHALIGQMLAFRTARTTILRRLGRQKYTAKNVNQIADLIAALSDSALNYELPTGQQE